MYSQGIDDFCKITVMYLQGVDDFCIKITHFLFLSVTNDVIMTSFMNNNNVLRMGDGTPNLLRTIERKRIERSIRSRSLERITETVNGPFLNGKNGNGRVHDRSLNGLNGKR